MIPLITDPKEVMSICSDRLSQQQFLGTAGEILKSNSGVKTVLFD